MTRRQSAAILVLTMVTIAGAAVLGPRTIRHIAFFRVREIEVRGLRYLDQEDVVRRLHLARDLSIVDPIGRVLAAAQAIPGVVAASAERHLPGTLRITLLEATPVALAAQGERLVLLDQRGRVLPFDPVRMPTSLPIAEPDSVLAAVLTRVMTHDSGWFAGIERVHRDGADVLLDAGPYRVRLRADASLTTLRAIAAVRSYLARSGLAWREIDARYQGRVFVRKGSA